MYLTATLTTPDSNVRRVIDAGSPKGVYGKLERMTIRDKACVFYIPPENGRYRAVVVKNPSLVNLLETL